MDADDSDIPLKTLTHLTVSSLRAPESTREAEYADNANEHEKTAVGKKENHHSTNESEMKGNAEPSRGPRTKKPNELYFFWRQHW